ncbi:uncharacterized protein LOC118738003 [Rhagoletis pomonella]|uniref:uncharacterized protein LOC118738003 n=1 Tax=Rhagoletis pomonella TaxID=28610 RepID=UPI0017835648|nr:uncharacterized protein LOC118738003 [Rhagoletis pomonella]
MNLVTTFTNNDSLHFHQISHLFAHSPTAATYVQAQLNGINFTADNQNVAANVNDVNNITASANNSTVNANINTISNTNINLNATIASQTTSNTNIVDSGNGAAGVPVVTYNGNQYCVITRNDAGAAEKSELLQIHGQFTTDKEGKTNIILMSPVSTMPVTMPMQMQMHVPMQVEVQNPN